MTCSIVLHGLGLYSGWNKDGLRSGAGNMFEGNLRARLDRDIWSLDRAGQNCNFSPCWPPTWRTPLQSQCTPNNIPFQSPFEVTYCSPHAQPPTWRPSLVAKKTCKSCILADIWTQHLTYMKQECLTLGYSFRGTEENIRLSVNQMHSEVSPFPYSKT